MNKLYLFLTVATLFFCACSSPNAKNTEKHQALFIKGSSNNNLEVLDWGGTGTPILFLAGLGDAAHIFDDFAPRFTNNFHVYGLARRGFGASYQPATDYSEKALSKDIMAVIDHFHLNKVILIGHSIAGEEISKFASSYPDRVSKVVYLDAAYDRTTQQLKELWSIPIQTPSPTGKDSSSFSHWKDFNKRIDGSSFPDEELKQISIFSKEGKYFSIVTPDSISTAIINGMESPDYTHITCPALALYAKFNSVKEVIPYYSELDSVNKNRANKFFILYQKYADIEQIRFKNQVHNGTVKFIDDANHYLFISNPVETEEMIRDFLR